MCRVGPVGVKELTAGVEVASVLGIVGLGVPLRVLGADELNGVKIELVDPYPL